MITKKLKKIEKCIYEDKECVMRIYDICFICPKETDKTNL